MARPMSEQRAELRETLAARPLDWQVAYEWLRAELRDLDRACESSRLLRYRTLVTRNRARLAAASLLLHRAKAVDCYRPLDDREIARRRARRGEMRRAWAPGMRMWRARGCLMSSEAAQGGATVSRQLQAELASALSSLAESVASCRGGR